MDFQETYDTAFGIVFHPGMIVPPGVYRLMGTQREIKLEKEDYLPASLNGEVACYVRVNHLWGKETPRIGKLA